MTTKKEDLRKVKITKYEDGYGDYVSNGYFHEWAKYPFTSESGTFQDTYAIVEMEDGTVKNLRANRLKFVDNF
jgi:hypothetical protein